MAKFCRICKEEKPLNSFSPEKTHLDGLHSECKKCAINCNKEFKKKFPWKRTYQIIKQRCNNPKNVSYKNYGERGIKCLITPDELKELWFRDKAYEMKKPSIDRIDNDGNYCLENCRYLELRQNKNNARIRPVIQLDKEGNFIREWESITNVSKTLKISDGNIVLCCKGINKSAGSFKWRYKNASS